MERGALRECLLAAGLIVLLKGVLFCHFLSQVEAAEERSVLATAVGKLAWHYDGRHYEQISREGYSFTPGDSNHAFFPLLPGVLWVLRALLGSAAVYDAGVVVLNALVSVVGGVLLFHAVRRDYGRSSAWWTVTFLFTAPTAVFFDMKYNESWFLLFTVLFLLAVQAGRASAAFLPGVMAGLTRPQGLVVSVLSLRLRERSPKALLVAGCASVVGFLAYASYVAAGSGEALAVASVQRSWHRTFNPLNLLGSGSWFDTLHAFLVLLCLVLGWRWLKSHDFWFFAALVALPLATGSLLSFSRFSLSMYPMFIVLSLLANRVPAFYVHAGVVSLFLAGRIIVHKAVSQGEFVA